MKTRTPVILRGSITKIFFATSHFANFRSQQLSPHSTTHKGTTIYLVFLQSPNPELLEVQSVNFIVLVQKLKVRRPRNCPTFTESELSLPS